MWYKMISGTPFVVGGSDIQEHEYPWVVGVYEAEGYYCVGTVLTSNYVVTAAHCLTTTDGQPKDKNRFTIIAGKHYRDINKLEVGSQTMKIKRLLIHEDYRGNLQRYRDDIALVELDGELTFNNEVQPICIDWNSDYEDTDMQEGKTGVIVSWGYTETAGSPSDVLKMLALPYRDKQTCWPRFPEDFRQSYFTSDKFCAGYFNKGAGICNGDSGGGLYFKSDGSKYYLRGIASLGVRTGVTCDPNNYGLFTRLSRYLLWLRRTILNTKTNKVSNTSQANPAPSKENFKGNGCVLPRHLYNGKYNLRSGDVYRENTYVRSSTLIHLQCKFGYSTSQIQDFVCVNNRWTPSLALGYCTAQCPPLASTDTYNATCFFGGTSRDCSNSVEGTVAEVACKQFHVFRETKTNVMYLQCDSGIWSSSPSLCEPECGRKNVNRVKRIIDGSDARPGEFPWVVSIYYKGSENATETIVCSGTIISRNFIITAAYCLANNEAVLFAEDRYTIVAGKYYSNFKTSEENAQIRKMKKVHLPKYFKGTSTKLRDNIALIEVEELQFSSHVQPICLDWSNRYDEQDLQVGNEGEVTGWGYTEEGPSSALVLQKLRVPYQSHDDCVNNSNRTLYNSYYTSDKFCAGYKEEGKSVCIGDEGAGLYFESEPGIYYLRGVLGAFLVEKPKCFSKGYVYFTHVSEKLSWIKSITQK